MSVFVKGTGKDRVQVKTKNRAEQVRLRAAGFHEQPASGQDKEQGGSAASTPVESHPTQPDHAPRDSGSKKPS